jgi:hypothetical protein
MWNGNDEIENPQRILLNKSHWLINKFWLRYMECAVINSAEDAQNHRKLAHQRNSSREG